MKVAVCVSGAMTSQLPGRNLNRNLELLRANFPDADFYFSSWTGYADKNINEDVIYFDEPEIPYHPYADVIVDDPPPKLEKMIRQSRGEKPSPKFAHQTKQILGHCYLFDVIPQDYDVYVRARWDTVTYSKAGFGTYLKDCFDNQIAIGFATLGYNGFNRIQQADAHFHNRHLFDQLIMHPPSVLDTKKVYKLSEEKKLIAAEFGWWQALGGNGHRCMAGWANPDRTVLDQYL